MLRAAGIFLDVVYATFSAVFGVGLLTFCLVGVTGHHSVSSTILAVLSGPVGAFSLERGMYLVREVRKEVRLLRNKNDPPEFE